MAQYGRSLPDPFQDNNTDKKRMMRSSWMWSMRTRSVGNFINKSSSGIDKSDNIKLKEPWHTLATSVISIVSIDHVYFVLVLF